MKEVGIQYSLQEFNGSLLKENIFRQDAGPDVDAAWESLGVNCLSSNESTTLWQWLIILYLDRSVRIPPEDAEQSGLATDQVKINAKYGGGFPANVEGLHHLHCLVGVLYPKPIL